MKTDANLRSDVEEELEWDPRFDSRDIGVAVKGGVVTLSGQVRSFAERVAAQEAAQLVGGVKAIANDIEVQLVASNHRSDTDIATAALNALRLNGSVTIEDIKLTVQAGWVTLTGQVPFWYQKQEAATTLRTLQGIKGISNELIIKIKPTVSTVDIKSRIEGAFRRHAQLDADKIRVKVADGNVTLEGEVQSWRERNDAEFAVWAAPGVKTVQDKLIVQP
jgi:osmotically-inducible protein OsmY